MTKFIFFQTAIAYQESNGIDIIVAIVLNDINPLAKRRMSLVLQLKNDAAKLLLSIMESRQDSDMAERIMQNIQPSYLVNAIRQAYNTGEADEVQGGESRGTMCSKHSVCRPSTITRRPFLLF